MKKKYLLTLLPLFALVSCASNNAAPEVKPSEPQYERGEVGGLPSIGFRDNDSTFITYLMMSPFGYLSADGAPVKGAVSDKFYENTIVWQGDPGTPLPTDVRSTVSGTTFRGWAFYDEDNDHVTPDYYTTVPSKEFVPLKAIFDGTNAGGNTGGGGSGGGSSGGQETSEKGFGIFITRGELTEIKKGEYKGTNFEGFEEFLVTRVTFSIGDKFCLYDPSTLGKWVVDINPYSFSPDPAHGTSDPARVASYVAQGQSEYTIMQDFTADLYIQILYQQDRLYIQLA